MLNNLTNFFNLIAGRKIKTSTTIVDTDLITLGTRDPNYGGGYQPTAISYVEFVNSLSAVGVQSVTGLNTDNTDPLNPVVELAIDDTTLAGQGTLLDPLRAIQTETAQVVLFADLATTEALKPCTYNNGTLGVGATLTGDANGQLSTISFTGKIDNTTTVLGQIILVKNQPITTNPLTNKGFQNGLYEVTQLGDVSTPFIITRTTDADTQAELYPVQVNVFNGTSNANTAFLQKTVDPVIGTSTIKFETTPIGITNTPVLHLDTVTSTVLPTCTYTAGTNVTLPGVGAFLQASGVGALGTINGIALVNGMRILVKDQVNQAHNGAYTVANAGNGTTAWKLVRVDAWGSSFVRLQREWKVNNSLSTKFGARYSTNLNSLANTAVGTTALVFNEVPTSGLPAWVETNATDLTIWCNGKGNTVTSTSFGDSALKSNTGGPYNTAVGYYAMSANTVGTANTAIGYESLKLNTTGSSNIAIYGLTNNLSGSSNVGIGGLTANTTGSFNTAVGLTALSNNSTGTSNTAIGYGSGTNVTTGILNVLLGSAAGTSVSTGNRNVFIGSSTGSGVSTGGFNTFVGGDIYSTSSSVTASIVLGYGAQATANNQFVVGSAGWNAGSVLNTPALQSHVWNVVINGTSYKILLAA
jgi:hypothetical protein